MILVSACLLGRQCRYDGSGCETNTVRDFLDGQSYFPICPEVLGGLSIPRAPAEILDGRVITQDGSDLTQEYSHGAEAALKAAAAEAKKRGEQIELAILKARSPSCGSNVIYDGSFSHIRVPGDGVFASLLKKNDIPVISEEEVLEEEEEDSSIC